MNTDTPKTDALYKELYDPSVPDDMIEHVSGVERKFMKELERENAAMRQAMKNVYDMLDGMDEQLEGNRGMFILMAQDELRPFIGP